MRSRDAQAIGTDGGSLASPENGPGPGALVVGAFADGTLPPSAGRSTRRRREDRPPSSSWATSARSQAPRCCSTAPGVAAERVLLVSLGRRDRFGDQAFRERIERRGAARSLTAPPGTRR